MFITQLFRSHLGTEWHGVNLHCPPKKEEKKKWGEGLFFNFKAKSNGPFTGGMSQYTVHYAIIDLLFGLYAMDPPPSLPRKKAESNNWSVHCYRGAEFHCQGVPRLQSGGLLWTMYTDK